MTFETALTGLNAAAADLDVTGNNIANGSTVGFKSSRAEFADIFAASNLGVSQNAIGQGVRLSSVSQQFTQGQFQFTGNNLDLSINGSGFFRVSEGGQIAYTRAGTFQLDRNGFVVDGGARRLTGYGADAAGNITGALTELRINTGDVAPSATTSMAVTANMRAGEAVPTVTPFDATDADSYNFSTSTTVYDSLGRAHLNTFYFVKTAASNEWQIHTQLAGDPAGTNGPHVATFAADGSLAGIVPAAPATVTGSTLSYSVANGAGSPIAGANPLALELDFSDLTQFGTPFSVTQLTQDGYPAGQFSSLSIEADGTIFARYTNGQSSVLGQVALAQFPSPQKLQQTGDTSWVESFASGAPITAAPGDSGLGVLQSGSLEQSNVNVSEQLVKMITAQRNYQANAKMISTQDAITQEILNIR